MKEIYDFLQEEYHSAWDREEALKQKNHAIDIQLEVINQTIEKIIMRNDTTSVVFSSSNSFSGFDGEEIKRLRGEQKELTLKKDNNLSKINVLEQKVLKMKELIQVAEEAKKNCGNKKIYNSYEVFHFQEMDRQRIARDIHDSVVQSLTVLIHKNQFIDKIMDTDRQRAHLELEKNTGIVKNSINELRNIIYNLRPMAFDDLGFEKTFYTLLERIKSNTTMIINGGYHCKEEKIDPVIAISAIRIIEELCSNSIKYSEGTRIGIDVSEDNDKLIIKYSDDGKGYDLNKKNEVRNNNTGFGLAIMEERILLLGGTLEAAYDKDKGELCYNIAFPLTRQDEDKE